MAHKTHEQTAQTENETDSVIYSQYDEQFQAFGLLAIILLIIEVCVLEVRNPKLKSLRLFNKKQKTK